MFSLFRWQKINFKTSQFNHFAFWRKSMTYDGRNVVKVFFATCPTNPIWVWVQRIPSFFMYYCKQKFYNHFCKAWGFMLQNQGNMPWWNATDCTDWPELLWLVLACDWMLVRSPLVHLVPSVVLSCQIFHGGFRQQDNWLLIHSDY